MINGDKSIKIDYGKCPRKAENAEKPGSYKQAFRIITPVIDRGDQIEIEQFFSGYGKIENAKLLFYTSDDFFDSKKSKIYASLGPKDGGIAFGVHSYEFESTGKHFDLSSGFRYKKWNDSSMFFDNSSSEMKAPIISTEMKIREAPFKYSLLTKKSIKPGKYNIQFIFSYFNGEKWYTDSQIVEFKVRNFLERYDVPIGWVALIASSVAITTLAIIPLIKWIANLI